MGKILFLFIVSALFISCNKQNKKIIIVAHRGASAYLPEHTLPAVALAHGFDIDYIEPDLVMTKDDQLIVMHDPHLDTTTNVAQVYPDRKRSDDRYYAVDFTLEEIKKLKVHERISLKDGQAVFMNRFPVGKSSFQVPTFEEYIELVQGLNKSRQKKIGIIPEIKAPEFHESEGKDIVSKTLFVLKAYGYEENNQAIIQCFEPNTLKKIKSKTNIPLLQLIAENDWQESSADYKKMLTKEGLKEIATYASFLGPWIPHLMKVENKKISANEIVTWAHEFGLKVAPYTVRDDAIIEGFSSKEEMMDFLIEKAKVDGVFSDFPDTVKR